MDIRASLQQRGKNLSLQAEELAIVVLRGRKRF
jgi:hypothetical protein